MDSAQKAMIEQLESMTLEQAREAVAKGKIYIGEPGSSTHHIASSWFAAREAALRDAREAESLKIAKESNSIALKARTYARWANIIAIISMILSIATAIGITIFQWLTRK